MCNYCGTRYSSCVDCPFCSVHVNPRMKHPPQFYIGSTTRLSLRARMDRIVRWSLNRSPPVDGGNQVTASRLGELKK